MLENYLSKLPLNVYQIIYLKVKQRCLRELLVQTMCVRQILDYWSDTKEQQMWDHFYYNFGLTRNVLYELSSYPGWTIASKHQK